MSRTLHLDFSNPADLSRAATLLRDGGLVAFATETVYGLGANALSAEAVAGIFAAKQRPSWDPLIVHLASVEQLSQVAEVPAEPCRPSRGACRCLLAWTLDPAAPAELRRFRMRSRPGGSWWGLGFRGIWRRGRCWRRRGFRWRRRALTCSGIPARRLLRMCWRIWTGGLMRCWTRGRRRLGSSLLCSIQRRRRWCCIVRGRLRRSS